MNLKINNELRCSVNLRGVPRKKPDNYIKEERRRTGRYIAILVGISLFLLAIYHAWVRRIPIVASLVVPALIMFFYVGWVLYTASRDKHKLLDAEAALAAAQEAEMDAMNDAQNNLEISIVSSKESSRMTSPDHKEWDDLHSVIRQDIFKEDKTTFNKPIILINDMPIEKPENVDQKWNKIVENLSSNEKLKSVQNRKKFKRKFCRKRRYAAFKRSYSIG